MKEYTSENLRDMYLGFFEKRGHKVIPSASLIPENDPTVLFTTAGMHPLVPYLLGEKHPAGKRLTDVQKCVRTGDIDDVGDERHCTFFEMLGNWSLGDYFKKEKTQWSYDILTKVFGLDGNEICSTVFEGNDAAPRDEETAELLKKVGIKPEHIFYLPKKDNWWELEGTVGTPCGPDNEWFYPRHDKPCGPNCGPDCGCGRYVEIGNDVYMQYKKTAAGYEPLANKNVDTGFGLDRLLAFLNGVTDGYKTDLFMPVINYLEEKSGKKYDEDEEARKAMRIIADHIRTSTMLIGDVNGIVPSNVGAGYILRRLLRRAIRYARKLGVEMTALTDVSKIFIEKIYDEAYPLLVEKEDYVISEIAKETAKFETTLATGLKEFNKCVEGIERKNAFMAQKDPAYVPEKGINGKQAFRLYDTFGFPLELTEELASEVGYTVDAKGFEEAFKEHQEKSKQQPQGVFKGGLEEQNEITARLHTATHLLNAALKSVLKDDNINQKGSNITVERLRFDFNFDRKLLPEELKAVEDRVNEAIKADVPVTLEEMSVDEAKAQGAVGVFTAKYGDKVKVYTMGKYSKEICGGPHASHTGELHHFRIVKEEASSAGVRRIKAVLD